MDRRELAEALSGARSARIEGGGTKLAWGARVPEPEVRISTAGLSELREHNAGDLTAVIEAGVPLAAAQARFAQAGQMLALDPPDDGATIGGVGMTLPGLASPSGSKAQRSFWKASRSASLNILGM